MKNLNASKQSLFDEFEIKGEWWLPESPENRIAGTLFFNKEEIILEVMGSWTNDDSLLTPFDMEPKEIILGISIKSESFTLIDLFPINQNTSIGGYSTVVYSMDAFVEGGHFNHKNEMLFSSCTMYPTYLTKWLNRTPLKYSIDRSSHEITAGYVPPKRFDYFISSLEATVREESNLELKDNDLNQRIQMHHTSGLSIISKELMQIDWFIERTNKLGNLVSTLIGKGVYLEKITFKGEFVEVALPRGKKVLKQKKYSYFKKQHDIRLKDKFNERDILVHFEEIEEDFEQLLNNWFDKYEELEVIHNLYFGFLYGVIHVDNTFLNSVQILEIYHRTRYRGKIFEQDFFDEERKKLKMLSKENLDKDFYLRVMEVMAHANDFTLNKRLNEIFGSFNKDTIEELIGTPDENVTFIKKLIDTRNFLAHFDDKRKPNLIKDFKERYYAIKRLEVIITLLLLKETGLEETKILEKFKNSIQHSHNLRVAKELLNNTGN